LLIVPVISRNICSVIERQALPSRREPRWGHHGSFSVIVDGLKPASGAITRPTRPDFASALKFGREFIGGHFVRRLMSNDLNYVVWSKHIQ
jgi:hypothetical protein